jgi:hypothetical protein
MSKKLEDVRYEVIVQEDTETGDLLLPIPPELLEQLGWKEGDEIHFDLNKQGGFVLHK